MKISHSVLPWNLLRWGIGIGVVVVAAAATSGIWLPTLFRWAGITKDSAQSLSLKHSGHDEPEAGDEGDSHDHGAEGNASETGSLELSAAARRNLGLTAEYLKPLELSVYRRSITIPAVVVPRPGRTQIQVATPLTGVVTHVHAVTGETVVPGTLLFEIRLTHEELVTAQTEFLKALGELAVEEREIARLETVVNSGAVSGKSLLDRKYAKEKLEALLQAMREALKLHGLSDRQVDDIATERRLLQELQIVAPSIDEHSEHEELRLSGTAVRPVSSPRDVSEPPSESETRRLVIEHLAVHKGQAVKAGDHLCSLADFTQLFIEGQAFDQDAPAIGKAAENDWPVSAIFSGPEGDNILEGLKLSFVGNEVDLHSRTLSFFVNLPNEITRETRNSEGQTFVSWKYRPGQRLQLRVPVEEWKDQLVVPVDAVINEGADWYVFQQNGAHFDRIPVHVLHRDQTSVVIANDGAVFPGDVIARRSAHQMQMAIRNKSGAGADPHAGHNH